GGLWNVRAMATPATTGRHLRRARLCVAAVLPVVVGGLPGQAAGIAASVTDGAGKPLAQSVVTVTPLYNVAVSPAAASHLAAATIDQRNERFVPDVVVIHPGDGVVYRNSNPTRQHLYSFAP